MAERAVPQLTLRALIHDIGSPQRGRYLMYSPYRVHMEPGRIAIEIFDSSKPPLPLAQWLSQVLGVFTLPGEKGKALTIRDFLVSVRNEQGPGHLDYKISENEEATDWPKVTAGRKMYPFYEIAVLSLGTEVAEQVRKALGPI